MSAPGRTEPPRWSAHDRGGELAAQLVDGADRSGIRLGDDEHRWNMGRRVAGGNRRDCQEPVGPPMRAIATAAGLSREIAAWAPILRVMAGVSVAAERRDALVPL